MATSTAGSSVYGTDLVAQPATGTNGGPSASGYSSAAGEVPEECDTTTTCGRGQAGYNGSANGFDSALLNASDARNSGLTFGCATSPSSRTADSGSLGSVLQLPGTYVGGAGGDSAISGDNQCYSPSATCHGTPGNISPNPTCSATDSNAGHTKQGDVWEAARTDIATNCTGTACATREFAATAYIAPTSPDGRFTAGTSCAGRVLVGGGQGKSTTDLSAIVRADAELYDPRVYLPSTSTPNPSFNTWTSVTTTMVTARDTPDVVELNDGRILLAGGEIDKNGNSDTKTYELFDPQSCQFESVPTNTGTMTEARYDFGMAKFGDGQVLACGGTTNGSSYTQTNSCDIFDPNGGGTDTLTNRPVGSWRGAGTTLRGTSSTCCAGNFGQALTTGKIAMIGGNAGTLSSVSEECAENGTGKSATATCQQSIATYQTDPAYGQSATEVPEDASHVRIGEVAGTSVSTSSALYGLVLECGGFGFNQSGSSLGVPPPKTCEFYVPAGQAIPATTTGLSCLASGTSTTGPAWCASGTTNIDMQRERSYFYLAEVPTSGPNVLALGGSYGVNSSNQGLMRKNVEYFQES